MVSGVDEKTNQPEGLSRIPKKQLSREDFLLLFIKQLQYQDPMKPIENNEMAMQMALFSQVDQLFELNESFERFLEVAENFDISTAASLVGKLVKAEGTTGRVEGGKFLGAEFELEEPSSSVEVVITNEEGEVVKRLELGALSAGTHRVEWDATDEEGNKVPDGDYQIKVILPNKDIEEGIPMWVYGRITGAVLGEENQVVINGRDLVNIKDIEEIYDSENF